MNAPEPERPFEAPWHADLFATTHALARAGAFDWADWAEAFGAALAKADADGAPKDGSTYYDIWLGALEQFLADRGLADAGTLSELNDAWRDAYLSTPHGQPVTLD
ncbi:MAG: nitrile hydratase accessory protein [Pseudomonadota bacterium]